MIEISGRFLYNMPVRRKKQQRHDPEEITERAERRRAGTTIHDYTRTPETCGRVCGADERDHEFGSVFIDSEDRKGEGRKGCVYTDV